MANEKPARGRYSRIYAGKKALGISNEELHDIVQRETGKDSLTLLTDKQVGFVGSVLWDMVSGRRPVEASPSKRTDEGGKPETIRLRKKIYMLAKDLGWGADQINAFSKNKYKVDRHEWLSRRRCNDMIEALKAMVERKNGKDGQVG